MATPLTRDVIGSMRPSKVFKQAKDALITSIDFDDSGHYALTCNDDETLQVYDCKAGKPNKFPVYSRKYGAYLAHFAHNTTDCLYASTKEDDTIRYLSLHDNHYIRYFKGHKQKVIGLEVSPVDDQFLSASVDGTVRLWDLRSANCHGLLTIPQPALVAFDPAGVVFAVGCEYTGEVLLYDLRNYDSEPFAVFRVEAAGPWTKLEFSNNGKYVLVATAAGAHLCLDAFSGELLMRCSARGVSDAVPAAAAAGGRTHASSGDACFSPDGRFVLAGAADRKIYVYDVQAPVRDGLQKPCAALECGQPPCVVGFNPRLAMLATADRELTFWLPDPARKK
ncbi:WD40-repeat-containing domain protein [Dipodascopsis tothii]|uniref:WD40-repeat-containing domain protein n=1 Tax=Dipodascopsis tothii TaxID=44089 RepID=UPI0034CF842C